MARYLIEDTYNGFRLSLLQKNGTPRHHYDEIGVNNGPICDLFSRADETWDNLRANISGDILFLIHNPYTDKTILAFGYGREHAKRKAYNILGGSKDTYVVEPLTERGRQVYLAGELSKLIYHED